MIKLSRGLPPAYLTDQKVAELTDKFKVSGESVWNHDDIKGGLLSFSFEKCAYCEASLSIESKYVEVEHFEDKDRNKDKVVDWANLLPSCKRCNGAKGTHDVLSEPIINPFDNDPRDHLYFFCYRFKGRDELGRSTVDVVDLNNSDRAVLVRFKIGEQIQRSLSSVCERFDAWKRNGSTRSKNIFNSEFEALLNECQPKASYAATAATVLHGEEDYVHLIDEMKSLSIWTSGHESLHCASLNIVVPLPGKKKTGLKAGSDS